MGDSEDERDRERDDFERHRRGTRSVIASEMATGAKREGP